MALYVRCDWICDHADGCTAFLPGSCRTDGSDFEPHDKGTWRLVVLAPFILGPIRQGDQRWYCPKHKAAVGEP